MVAAARKVRRIVAIGGLVAAVGGAPATQVALPSLAGDAITLSTGSHHAAGASAAPPTTAQCEKAYGFACYGATQIQQAYDEAPLFKSGITGKGQTIVIVDSFGSPTIQHDLGVFDKAYGLPAPPKLTIIHPAGKIPPFSGKNDAMTGWAGETTLDVEYAHTIAPGANILLVETPVSEEEGTSGFPQIETAEKYVIAHHLGGVISQSFGATEETFPTTKSLLALRGAYVAAAKAGVTVLTASGDSGAADTKSNETTYYLKPVTSWPDSDPLITGVGGTQLHLATATKARTADTVWNDTYNVTLQQAFYGDNGPNPLAGGGGKSAIFPRPSYQNKVAATVGADRGVPDISMSGACDGSVNTYQSFPGYPAGWYPTCGTSEATPLFAGIVALAEQKAKHSLGTINPALYALSAKHAAGIVDVTKGNNTVGFTQGGSLHTVTGFKAVAGYDLASGVGTVDAAKFVPELAAAG
ncbi:S53 family peptidase [Jatrophihabitans sp.]|uniref:S53 family peptidase n=1 Tax=Jatrophihabitans sp. TaxID=1932789 RepID=UPI0030C699D5|nr:Peptidase [Jatrophihabitans sp.]